MATASTSSPVPAPVQHLWRSAFNTYCDSLLEEQIADKLIRRWSFMDEITKVLVAVTASGSAITGWVIWSHPGAKVLWGILAGSAALLSILHSTLGVPGRIKAHAEDQQRFASLRADLETFRDRMRFQPHNDITAFEKEFLDLKKRFSDSVKVLTNDTFRTTNLDKSTHREIVEYLKDEIQQANPSGK